MRLNIEETAWRHIPRLAKEMRWSEREAAGALFRFWRDTQQEELVTAPRSRVATAVALGFDSDEEIERFLNALIKAQLAAENDDGYTVRGNGDHVDRLSDYRDRASKAGKASAKARNGKFNDFVNYKSTSSQPTANVHPTSIEPSYAPMLPFSNTEELNTGDLDLPTTPKKTRKPKSSTAATQPSGATVQFRDAWLSAYRSKYKAEYPWGAREGGQVSSLLGSYTSDQLVGLIPFWFAWQRPEVIRGGHSLGKGNACFLLKLDELRADIADSDRRAHVAVIQDTEKQATKAAAKMGQAERLAQRFTQGAKDDDIRVDQARVSEVGTQTVLGFGEAAGADVRDLQSATE